MGCCQSQNAANEPQTVTISIGEVKLDFSQKTLTEVKPEIDKAIKFLKRCEDFSAQEAAGSLEILVHHASIGSNLRQEVAKYLLTLGYGELYVKMTESLHEYRRGQNRDTQGVYNLMIIQMAFWNFTDVCGELGRDLGEHGGVGMLLEDLEVLGEHLGRKEVTEYVEVLLGILHNAIHLCGENQPIYRKANAVGILTKLLSADDMTVKMKALLVLAYCVDEEESGILATAHGCVSFLTYMLQEAVAAIDHRVVSGNSRFSAKELLDGLTRLAINDDNKREILKEDGIVTIARMLKPDFSEEEQRLAAEAMWNLSFVEDIRRNSQVKKCTPVLEELSTSENEGLREASRFALWEIKEGDKDFLPEPTQCSEPSHHAHTGHHVMISYQWGSQHLALCIKEHLVAAGYEVWMDIDKMKGNLLHAMAEAIEQSAVVVVCMSQKYKESLSCRSEASYAYKKEKPLIGVMVEDGYEPDGWLGLLLGMQLYYNGYSEELMRKNISSIINEIKERGYRNTRSAGVDVIDSPTVVSQQETQLNTVAPASIIEVPTQSDSDLDIRDQVRSWSKKQVQQWFEDNDLTDLSTILDFCDGKHLLTMYNRHKEAPESFQIDLKSDLELGFNTRLKFSTALDELLKD
ncbi:uncharacterized protein [Amphiura filiformis]|uniref:uncharacterized protein n=1 Tax=Amphiura filiformis TaxID=82378 RepID=UPI003B212C92